LAFCSEREASERRAVRLASGATDDQDDRSLTQTMRAAIRKDSQSLRNLTQRQLRLDTQPGHVAAAITQPCHSWRMAALLHTQRYPQRLGTFLCWRIGGPMAIHKVIEVISQSEKSWEDAAQRAVADAGKSVEQIKSIWIKNFEAVVKDSKIVEYRVNANITFEVKQ
jgi:flavin-binding protein dodecin